MGRVLQILFSVALVSSVSHAEVNCAAYLSAAQLRAVASPAQKAIAAVLFHSYVTGITVRWNDVEPRTVEVLEDARGNYDFAQLNLEHVKTFSITIQSQNPRYPSETFTFVFEDSRLSLKLNDVQPRYVSVKNRRMILAIYAALAMVPDAHRFSLEFAYIVERGISRLVALPNVFGSLQKIPPAPFIAPAGSEVQLKVEYVRS